MHFSLSKYCYFILTANGFITWKLILSTDDKERKVDEENLQKKEDDVWHIEFEVGKL